MNIIFNGFLGVSKLFKGSWLRDKKKKMIEIWESRNRKWTKNMKLTSWKICIFCFVSFPSNLKLCVGVSLWDSGKFWLIFEGCSKLLHISVLKVRNLVHESALFVFYIYNNNLIFYLYLIFALLINNHIKNNLRKLHAFIKKNVNSILECIWGGRRKKRKRKWHMQ